MGNFNFDDTGRVIVENFAEIGPFSSFLPGIAGPMGIPMWVFYVNRGQGIAGFGVESKDTPIMEFQPANKAYQSVPYTGFRTFIKARNGSSAYYEPFAAQPDSNRRQQMIISPNEFEIQETNSERGLQVNVSYFTLPGEGFAGLVRQVTITNTNKHLIELEVLDGLAQVIPYGVNNWLLKEMNKTLEAWMEVYNMEVGIPFYHVRASVADKVEVEGIQAGHFYLSFVDDGEQSQLLPALVDPAVVFGQNTSLSQPDEFISHSLPDLLKKRQIQLGKTPCGLFGVHRELKAAESVTLYSIIGHVSEIDAINCDCGRLTKAAYIESKREEARTLAQQLTDVVDTHTSHPVFDAYCRQNFLDNVLRGGWPIQLGSKERSFVYHLYSRKHGDLERDYNAYFLSADYYSQGNGAYRDVNQNRRSDVLVNPQVEDFNVVSFMNLLQTDGYNPLVIQGSQFTIAPDQLPPLSKLVDAPDKLKKFLEKPFSPGQLLKYLKDHHITLKVTPNVLLSTLLSKAEQHFAAAPGEGYWVDHWTYNLDLVETYLAVYPDHKDEMLFGKPIYTFYDNPAIVRPRAERYVLATGGVRQFNALAEDKEKEHLLASRSEHKHVVRTQYGKGEVFQTTLFAKLTALAAIKFATLDPFGMGIEMEGGRPGWYDALNGLPGLFGSSMPETYELNRLLSFLISAIDEKASGTLALPIEVYQLLEQLTACLNAYDSSSDEDRDFVYWDAVSTLRENFRAATRLGLDGLAKSITLTDLQQVLGLLQAKVQAGIARAEALNDGLPPTYLSYQVEDYTLQTDQDGNQRTDDNGRSLVVVHAFAVRILPPFLEGPVRALKIVEDSNLACQLHKKVKTSPLFDRKLKTYKVNASLDDEPMDIGRTRAFTAGWLENESIWLHMTYKYMLSMLQAGLYNEFYEDFRNVIVPFLDPDVYGRSPLENSSFIVSSAHPDEALHGHGFVARLSGSTAEFISIWHLMMAGKQPFGVENGELCLQLNPSLPGWLFDEAGTVSFTFLGNCKVTYHNPSHKDTFGANAVKPSQIRLLMGDQWVDVNNGTIGLPYAEAVRNGQVTAIEVGLA